MKVKLCFLLAFLMLFVVGVMGCEPEEDDPELEPEEPEEVEPEEFPRENIELVIPFGAGGGTDRWARSFASVSGDYLDGSVFVPANRPGGGSAVGVEYVLDQEPDGHTVLIGSSTPNITAMVEDVGYEYDDLKVIATYRAMATVITVQPDAPYQNWDEFVEYAEESPGEINFGGTGGAVINGIYLFDQLGIEVNPILYDSTGEAATDFLGGHLEVFAGTPPAAAPLLEAGDGIGILHTQDFDLGGEFEGVPNAADVGLEPYFLLGYFAVHPDVPDDICEYLGDAIGQMVEDESFLSLTRDFGEPAIYTGYPESHELYVNYIHGLEPVVERLFIDQ